MALGTTFLVPVANARLSFTDAMEIPSWAEEAIEELMDQGVINGNDDGSFAPNRQLNRAEVSKIIVLASGVDIDTTGGPHFPDVKDGAWYYDYIETMYNQGWINGYPDGYFRPAVGINRAEIAKMVVNAFEIDQDLSGAPHFDDAHESDWFYGYVETVYNNGLMLGYGDGTFGPANAVTRAETVKVVYEAQVVAAPPSSGPTIGTLEVTLSDDTPRGTNVPFNATSVPYTTVELTASDDSDVEIRSLTFTRLGLGDNDDFDNVWLEIDGFKIGNDKSINNDDIVELRFNPPIVVPAGQTIVADVVASAKYSSTDKNIGHHNRLALVSADDIDSTAANIAGDFPIEGEEMEVADYEVSTLEMTKLGADTTIDVGDNFIEIGKFRMLNKSNTNKDVEIRAITFKNDGTAEIEDTLENVALYVSGEQVSAETIMDGDYITFRLDNGITGGYIIEDGDSKIFSIRADIVSAEKNDSITFKIDNFEDIVGVEIGTSFGIKGVAGDSGISGTCTAGTSAAEDECATLATYTIDSGDLNISRDPSSLGNQTYAPGSNDVVLLTARVIVDQPLIVDGLRVDVATTSSIADKDSAGTGAANEVADLNETFDNFRFYLNDKLIDSENDFTGSSTALLSANNSAYLNFNTTFEIAGTSIIKVVANITDRAEDADKLKLEIRGNTSTSTSFLSPEYISTGDRVDSSQVLGSAQGSFVEVQASLLDITRTDGLSSGDKIVAGVDDVEFMKFVLDSNDSGDVNVTSITVRGLATGKSRNLSNYTLAVFVDGVQQGSAKNLKGTTSGTAASNACATSGNSGDCTATFNDLSVVIPSAGQKEFVIVVDTIEDSAETISATLGGDPPAFIADGTANDTVNVGATMAAELSVGDVVTLTEAGVNSGDPYEVEITAISSPSITFSAGAALDYSAAAVAELKHTMQMEITDVQADNIENGQTVTVDEGGAPLTTSNTLPGATFELVQSGQLSVSTGSSVYSDILIANSSNVEVLKVRFNAADDEVQIKDLYFVNDLDDDGDTDTSATVNGQTLNEELFGDRVSFKIFNEAGQLIQEKQMTAGDLHFELGNQDRIRVPKDDSTYVTIKVDVRDITKANQTGNMLKLSLNTLDATGGVEAVTAATGTDITTPTGGWGDTVGQTFVAYRTEVTVKHATSQPTFSDPSASSQEMYRFTVTADSARQVEIERVTLDVTLQGMDKVGDVALATTDFAVRQLRTNGTVDDTATVATIPAVYLLGTTGTANTADNSARVVVDFANQKLSAGESRTYVLFVATLDNDGTASDDDSVSVTIIKDTGYQIPNTQTEIEEGVNSTAGNADDSNLVWSDESSTSHSDTTADWLNGYLVNVDSTAKVIND
jgi:hypothetical protein